jgi:hypothetical protein
VNVDRRAIGDVVAAAGGIDWSHPQSGAQRAREVLDRLTDRPDLLVALVRDVAAADARAGAAGGAACESYPNMDKLVLWQSPDGAVRLRLHVFFPGYVDRPHNHRWSFVSRIVTGGYLHTVYGSDVEVLREVGEGREPQPRYLRREGPGGDYFLADTMVHSLRVDEVTVSLLLRGPAVKDRYFTVLPPDGHTAVADRLVFSGGAAQESAAERQTKRLTAAGIARVVGVLDGVLAGRVSTAAAPSSTDVDNP